MEVSVFGILYFFLQIVDTIGQKKGLINDIEEYNSSVSALTRFFDDVINEIEAVVSESELQCHQKLEKLKDMKASFETNSTENISSLQVKADQIANSLGDFDLKQIDDQVCLFSS